MSPLPPQPSLLSLVTSGIQMWKPNRFILKGDLLQGRGVAGICVSQWAGRGSEWRLCRSLVAPGPSAWRNSGHLPWTARL